METKNIISDFVETIENNPAITETEKNEFYRKMAELKEQKVNILITGATGAGKSSTINALFNTTKAKVGYSADPETMAIARYELNNLVIYDSPGLGDGIEADRNHAKGIVELMHQLDDKGELLIDLVLVIVDGATRDLGTTYELINRVIIPNLGEDTSRLLIAINRSDLAMSGHGWDKEQHKPTPALVTFLEEKVTSLSTRVKRETGLNVTPIYFSAGATFGEFKLLPYNLSKLLAYIVRHTRMEKRIVLASDINMDKTLWEKDDELEDYRKDVKEKMEESFKSYTKIGGDIGEAVGSFFGERGKQVGRAVGSVIGGFIDIFF